MITTATCINYYHICHRKLWLFSNGIRMEHTSDTVYDGKLLHDSSYPQRAEKHTEVEISAIYNGFELSGKIDFYDAKEKVIHEIKRSDKIEDAHEWQVKYYIWLLELNDITGVRATLEYPKLRSTLDVILGNEDRKYLVEIIPKIALLKESEECPLKINSKICKNCSYYDLCYVVE
jgi:CRISPR-associated exonuclease Cas4